MFGCADPVRFFSVSPTCKSIEFDGIRMQAGINRFVLTARQWKTRLFGDVNSESLKAPTEPFYPIFIMGHLGHVREVDRPLEGCCKRPFPGTLRGRIAIEIPVRASPKNRVPFSCAKGPYGLTKGGNGADTGSVGFIYEGLSRTPAKGRDIDGEMQLLSENCNRTLCL